MQPRGYDNEHFPTMLQALVTEITLLAHDTPNDPGLITIQTSGY